MALFERFDVDNTGFISKENLQDAFRKAGKVLTDDEIDQIIVQHDIAKDGVINLEEFKLMMNENVEFDLDK